MPDSPYTSDTSESTAVGPPAGPLPVTPPPAPPPVATPISVASEGGGKEAGGEKNPAAGSPRIRAVPPPPPTRATLPPVRPATTKSSSSANGTLAASERSLVSGVGSAKSGRWRDAIPSLRTQSAENSRTAKPDDEDEGIVYVHRESAVPSWLISTVLHLVLLLVLALITTPAGTSLSRVLLTIGQSERDAPVELTEFSIDPAEEISDSNAIEDSPIEVDLDSLLTEVPMDVPQPMLTPGQTAASDPASETVEVAIGATETLTVAKPMFGGRSGAMRKALLAIYGGTQETEDAVELGLMWLKAQQQRNGSWSLRGPYNDGGTSENNAAATAMALLAFMGAGNTHTQGPYAAEVQHGVTWLVSQQDRSGFMAKSARDHERMYAQAQATIALCELYGMTGDSRLRGPAQLAIDFASESQSPEGGWRYEPRFDSDTSVTGWFLMGVKSGASAGLEVNQKVFYRVEDYLDSVQSFDGAAYGYQRRRDASPAMTAEGLLCRQYLGWQRNVPAMGLGLETLVESHMMDLKDRDVYYWYYATQALHHFGGPLWKEWNSVMRVELPTAQVKKGAEKGSWSPQQDDWGATAGRLYTTCLSIYCLEVYYRHMPLYSQSE